MMIIILIAKARAVEEDAEEEVVVGKKGKGKLTKNNKPVKASGAGSITSFFGKK